MENLCVYVLELCFCKSNRQILFCNRVQAYIRNGWSHKVFDPDQKAEKPNCSGVEVSNSLGSDWQSIKDAFTAKQVHLSFTNAQIINYSVARTAVDGMPASDLQAINSSALNLFRCGHVQDIKMCFDKHLCIKANCLPEMRKDCVYKLFLFLDLESWDITGAECGCSAGKGPCASCKHIGAICYALEEFSRLGKLPESLTCTDKLQQWNRPRPKKLEVIPVVNLTSRRCEILKIENKGSLLSTFDPRQPNRELGSETMERLCCDLLSLNQPCAFLDILVPSPDKFNMITHIHYHQLPVRTCTEKYM